MTPYHATEATHYLAILKAARIWHNWDQNQMAKVLGLNRNYYSDLERGQRPPPLPYQINYLAPYVSATTLASLHASAIKKRGYLTVSYPAKPSREVLQSMVRLALADIVAA